MEILMFSITTDASATVTLSVNGVKQDDIPVLTIRNNYNSDTYNSLQHYRWTSYIKINNLIKDTETKETKLSREDTQSKSKPRLM
jgi:hypothetical protein